MSKNDFEAIIGTADAFDGEPTDNLSIACATERLKEAIPDASVWRVDVYDGGGIGLNFDTTEELEAVEEIEHLETMSVLSVTYE